MQLCKYAAAILGFLSFASSKYGSGRVMILSIDESVVLMVPGLDDEANETERHGVSVMA